MKVRYFAIVFIAHFSVFLLLGINSTSLFAQRRVAYMTPDIGTPGTNVYIELFSYTNSLGAFGYEPVIADSSLYLETADIVHSQWIQFSPLYVSWGGRLITAQMFIHPDAPANSEYCISSTNFPIALKRKDGSLVDGYKWDFFIVKPFHLGDISAINETVLGDGKLGVRSPLGSMIVDSLILGDKCYTVSTRDQATTIEGEQGYLPFTLTVLGTIKGQASTVISVDADKQNGGPGGGGGGGGFSDNVLGWTGKQPGDSILKGGVGFTGGAPGGINGEIGISDEFSTGGAGSGSRDSSSINNYAGYSLNGVRGAFKRWYEAAGGGTGHPFGTSGEGCVDGNNHTGTGGYGGGSGDKQLTSGGNGTYLYPGTYTTQKYGKIHGNKQIVPLAGGSAGASGNPQGWGIYSGYGGGGGGAIAINAKTIDNISVSAKGGNGGNSTPNGGDLCYGGSGSGGAILLTSKIATNTNKIDTSGGFFKPTNSNDTSKAGSGVFRNDAFNSDNMIGSVIDTTKNINKLATTKITGRTQSNTKDASWLYIKGEYGGWTFIGTVKRDSTGRWEHNFTPAFWAKYTEKDSIFYLYLVSVKSDAESASLTNDTTSIVEPNYLLSQAAASVLHATIWPEPHIELVRNIPCDTTYLCNIDAALQNQFSIQAIRNIGKANLIFDNTKTTHTLPGWDFKIGGTNGFPIIKPQDTSILSVTYTIPANIPAGLYTDTILLYHNDTARQNPWQVVVQIPIERSVLSVTPDTIDVGTVYLTASTEDTTINVFLATNSDESVSYTNISCNSTYFNYDFSPQRGAIIPNDSFPIKVSYVPKNGTIAGTIDDSIIIRTTCGNVICHIIGTLEESEIETEDTIKIDLGKISKCAEPIVHVFNFANDIQVEGYKKESIKISATLSSGTTNYQFTSINSEWLENSGIRECTITAHDLAIASIDTTLGKKVAVITFNITSYSGWLAEKYYKFEYEIVPAFDIKPNPINFGIVKLENVTAGDTIVNISYLPTLPSTFATIDTAYLKYGTVFKLQTAISQKTFTPQVASDIAQITYNVNAVGNYTDTLVLEISEPKCKYTTLIPVEITIAADPKEIKHDLTFENITLCDTASLQFDAKSPSAILNLLERGDTLWRINNASGANADMFSYTASEPTYWVFDNIDGRRWWERFKLAFKVESGANTIVGTKTAIITLEIHKANGVLETHYFNLSAIVVDGITASDYTNSVDFGTVWLPQDANVTKTIVLTNSTPTDLQVTSKLKHNVDFALLDDFSLNLASTATSTANVGVIGTEEGTFNDTLEVTLHYPLCDKILLIPITAIKTNSPARSSYIIKIEENLAVDPATESFTFPVYITSDRDLVSGSIDSLELLIKGGRDLFYPTAVQNANTNWESLNAGLDIVIKLAGINIPRLTANSSQILFSVTGIPMLSNLQTATIGFNGKLPKFNSDMLVNKIDTVAGKLSFIICQQGNDRLVKNSQTFTTISTNPITNSMLEIDCIVAEIGQHFIEIVDITGNSWVLKQWNVSNLDNKEFHFNISLADFFSGSYYLIIHSPTQQYSKQIVIAK